MFSISFSLIFNFDSESVARKFIVFENFFEPSILKLILNYSLSDFFFSFYPSSYCSFSDCKAM